MIEQCSSKKMSRLSVGCGVIVVLLSATNAYAAGGTLDPTFGLNGIVTTQFNSLPSSARDIAIQADGKILVLGSIS